MRTLLVSIVDEIRKAGVQNASQEAGWLMQHAVQAKEGAEEDVREWLTAAVKRRCAGEPLAYIIGQASFYNLENLVVSPDVLIPRFETEQLVDLALLSLASWQSRHRRQPRLLDVGTGSGAIALALARAQPELDVFATDVSDRALWVAKENARRLDIKNVSFLPPSHLLDHAIGEGLHFDIVVANLPYISDNDAPSLDRGVVDYEPHLALFDDHPLGVGLIAELVQQAPAVGASVLWAEHGSDPRVVECLANLPSYRQSMKDLTGRHRFTVFEFQPC